MSNPNPANVVRCFHCKCNREFVWTRSVGWACTKCKQQCGSLPGDRVGLVR